MKKMLVVDDMNQVYERISKSLNREYISDYADSVEKGKRMLRDNNYDILITDFEIGEHNPRGGIEMIAEANNLGVPAICMSMKNYKLDALNQGAWAFLFKKELYELLESGKNLNCIFLNREND